MCGPRLRRSGGRRLRTQPSRPLNRRLAAATLAVVALLTACSAPVRPDLPTSSPSPAAVRVPADGISLELLGFSNGPVDAFSLPRNAVIATSVDQPSGVTVVLSHPTAVELASYLRRALPETGFVITQDSEATATFSFTGYGWHGSFTGTAGSSAVILRP
jgi:hypothetical protein